MSEIPPFTGSGLPYKPPPASTSYIEGSGIKVLATIFEGNVLSADRAVATLGYRSLDHLVSGWSEPNHRRTSQAGTERLEDGSTITDHVVPMPARLSMRGHVSDVTHPLGSHAAGEAWDVLKRLHQEKALLSVITEWDTYTEMFIRNLDTTQTMRGMEFTIELQEVVRVGVQEFTPKGRSKTAEGRAPSLSTAERTIYGRIVNGTFYRFVNNDGTPGFEPVEGGQIIQATPGGRLKLVTNAEAAALDQEDIDDQQESLDIPTPAPGR